LHHVFVYGTLRKYEDNHHLLENSRLVFEQASVKGELYDTGYGYPALFIGEGTVYGEVYEVDDQTLRKLDILEDFNERDRENSLYDRTYMTVKTDKEDIKALVYYMKKKEHTKYRKINSGDWKEYLYSSRKPESTLYFAYGSCMDTNRFQIHGVNHHFTNVIGAGKLHKYSLRFTVHADDGGRADIVEDGGEVEGILYELPYEAVRYLYKREGVGISLYRPTFVNVEVGGKMYQDCLTFVVVDKKKELAPPDHYKEEILRGAKGRLSEAYYQKIDHYMNQLPKD